ncbi:MAG: hypothetical protein ABI539_01840 [Acidobacteriota bacterium]
MNTLIRIYSASCIVVVGFFTFFLIPWHLLPFSDAANITLVGSVIVALSAGYIFYCMRRDGADLGWFLVDRGGLFAITFAVLGIAAFVCGTLLFVWPDLYVPAFEQGALPFGIMLVSLFWLALIFMFGFLTFGMVARVAANVRLFQFSRAAVDALIALVCLGMAAVFFSLFLEVINDIAIRISNAAQWNAIWTFTGLLLAAGIIRGAWESPSQLLDEH